mgnify:CR=1 FL=1
MAQNVGKRLRDLRHERALTLAQLGQRAGLSASYLSQIERSVIMPSLSNLTTIAMSLDVEIGYFFEDTTSSPSVVRSKEGKVIERLDDAIVEFLSADPSGKKIQPYRVVCQPGASREQPPTHSREKFGFVLKGQLTVTVGQETFMLKAGDSIHYQTLQPHSWRNEGDEECVTLWMVSPSISNDEFERQVFYEQRHEERR